MTSRFWSTRRPRASGAEAARLEEGNQADREITPEHEVPGRKAGEGPETSGENGDAADQPERSPLTPGVGDGDGPGSSPSRSHTARDNTSVAQALAGRSAGVAPGRLGRPAGIRIRHASHTRAVAEYDAAAEACLAPIASRCALASAGSRRS
jgi:hypothetical protein